MKSSMLLPAATIVSSAFLLFVVQPLLAKQILPWFGGAASVWTTCLLFFQGVLLAGYIYADQVARRLSAQTQVRLHVTLLALSLASLPIVVDADWKPAGNEAPSVRILCLLAATIGLPYFMLSTTTPLVQAWSLPHVAPARRAQLYRLFALSNFASLLALLAYPLWIEPAVGVRTTAWLWSAGYALFAALSLTVALRSRRAAPRFDPTPAPTTPSAEETLRFEEPLRPTIPTSGAISAWLLLSATAVCLLMAVTNHITQNVASVPLLWVVPLALYLVTFVVCFDHPRWYARGLFMPLMAITLAGMAWRISSLHLELVAPLFAVGLFAGCMFCHGELARMKPEPQHLTLYYLAISAGGVLGALVVAVVAPLTLRGYFELHGVLALLSALLVWRAWRAAPALRSLTLSLLVLVGYLGAQAVAANTRDVRVMERNFYGVVRTRDWHKIAPLRVMYHGAINHGGQYLDPARALEPTCYSGRTSGYGRLLRSLEGPRKIGVIGLGAGGLMAYARPGDEWVFYELDPMVVEIAAREFSFEEHSGVHAQYVIGDGRLALEREAPRGYDLLAIDAFSGDAIPMHLITREAMALYARHLAPGGAIVFQATNRFVDLLPVIRRLADDEGMHTWWIRDRPPPGAPGTFTFETDQVIVTHSRSLLDRPLLQDAGQPAPGREDLAPFTDDYYNLFGILTP